MNNSQCGDKPTCGPGYRTPMDAYNNGPRERLLYVSCIRSNIAVDQPDYLATVDVDPTSRTYSQVTNRLEMPYIGDELHNSGWNACSSCYTDIGKTRHFLIFPALLSDRIYIIDTKDEKAPFIHKVISGEEIRKKTNMTALHTVHCLGSGDVMVSGMGDSDGNGKGSFLLLEGHDFSIKDVWQRGPDCAPLGYAFWYQPFFNVMLSTEWCAPNVWKKGFSGEDLKKGLYGSHVNVWDWTSHRLVQRIDLGPDGTMPLEVRFLHDPRADHAYVSCAVGSAIFRVFPKKDETWEAEKVIQIPWKKVTNWMLPKMPAMITNLIISLDDRFLFANSWLHGDIRQYDITDRARPRLVGQIFLGGSICNDGNVKVIDDPELEKQPEPLYMNGKRLVGGPQMMQLSLDGRRMYVTTSIMSTWDEQFYPKMTKCGGYMLRLDIDTVRGGLKLNPDFFVDFSAEPNGPVLAHEMRYPGGDCTSEIWLAS